MVEFYVRLIILGKKKIEDVPERWREKVKAAYDELVGPIEDKGND